MHRRGDVTPTVRTQVRILLCGTEAGVGTTRMGLSLANAAASALRRRTLYVEIGANGMIAGLRTKDTFAVASVAGFSHYGVDYLPCVTKEEACGLPIKDSWDVIIYDITDGRFQQEMLAICQEAILLANISPWHYETFCRCMRERMKEQGLMKWEILSPFANDGDIRRVREAFGETVRAWTPMRDPFCLTREEIALLRRWL